MAYLLADSLLGLGFELFHVSYRTRTLPTDIDFKTANTAEEASNGDVLFMQQIQLLSTLPPTLFT